MPNKHPEMKIRPKDALSVSDYNLYCTLSDKLHGDGLDEEEQQKFEVLLVDIARFVAQESSNSAQSEYK